MANFIEEFYYGNIDPQARSAKQNKVVQKQMEVLMLNKEFLTERLSGENKKKFLDFVNAWGVVNGKSKEIQSNLQGGVIMEKHIYSEQMDIGYTLHGDYSLPLLIIKRT